MKKEVLRNIIEMQDNEIKGLKHECMQLAQLIVSASKFLEEAKLEVKEGKDSEKDKKTFEGMKLTFKTVSSQLLPPKSKEKTEANTETDLKGPETPAKPRKSSTKGKTLDEAKSAKNAAESADPVVELIQPNQEVK